MRMTVRELPQTTDDRVDRRRVDGELARRENDSFVDHRALTRIDNGRASGRRAAASGSMLSALTWTQPPKWSSCLEMRVIGGEGGQAAAFIQHLIEQIPAFAAVGLDGAAMIVDLDRMGDIDGAAVLDGELRPGGMGDADKGSGLRGAPGEPGPVSSGAAGRKVERQARRDDMPELAADVSGACSSDPMMVVKPLERKPRVSAIGQSIAVDEMVRQHHEVVARILIGIDDPSGGSPPSERVEWVWRLPRQNRPASENGERSVMDPR